MATQRITIVKVGGVAANTILRQIRAWSAARQGANPDEWSSAQWPADVRRQADHLACQLRENSHVPPVLYFAEWIDLWSAGDLFLSSLGQEYRGWLVPPGGPLPFVICADRFTLFGYGLPDDGCLARYLKSAGPLQFVETAWFVRRLSEAVKAWEKLVQRAVIVVLREVLGATVTDEEMVASLASVPGWLSALES